jgi:acyl-CoA reductase-like NAD-dependent aldehyde dehydrogenase
MTNELNLLIDGEYRSAGDGATFDSRSPIDGATIGRVASATDDDVETTVRAAQRAFAEWSTTSYAERRRVLLGAAVYLEENASRLRERMAAEVGLPVAFAAMNIAEAAATLREAAAVTSLPTGQVLPSHDPATSNLSMRVPAGVVLAIVPWNAPLILAARSTAIAVAVGNTVIIRPSEEAPYSAGHLLAEALLAAGAPAGTVNVLTSAPGQGARLIRSLIEHPLVRRIVFIGSTIVGRKIAALAGEFLTPAVMELGGKNATIVLEDADLDWAADTILFASLGFGGQICMATDRIIVPEVIADDLTERLVRRVNALAIGDPRDPATFYGPLINSKAVNHFSDLVADAVAHGARALTGDGSADGLYARPVILEGVDRAARLYYEESFAPIVAVHRVPDEAAAVRLANDSEMGLIGSVLSADEGRALRVAGEMHAGAIHVNGASIGDEPHVPFGGIGMSGQGRLGGLESVYAFTEQRTIYVHGARFGLPILKDRIPSR